MIYLRGSIDIFRINIVFEVEKFLGDVIKSNSSYFLFYMSIIFIIKGGNSC